MAKRMAIKNFSLNDMFIDRSSTLSRKIWSLAYAVYYTEFDNGAAFTTNAFKFTCTDFKDFLLDDTVSSTDSSDDAYNGTDYFIAYFGFSIASASAAPFSLTSIDLAPFQDYSGVTTATLTGTKVGGGIVTKIISLDPTLLSHKQTGNDFTTYLLTGFDNLSSLSITHNGTTALAVDNVVLNVDAATVPEPSSIALFGLALAAGALVRRRA